MKNTDYNIVKTEYMQYMPLHTNGFPIHKLIFASGMLEALFYLPNRFLQTILVNGSKI
jgi:hypothetical protein